MSAEAPQAPDEDRAARQEVLGFLASRYEAASLLLQDSQWESFRSFTELWLDTYDWRSRDRLEDYLRLEPAQRRDRFERFQRQAESWDTTLEFPVDRDERMAAERQAWRRDFADKRKKMKERAEREASHWESVRRLLEAEHARRRVPTSLLQAFERLGLAPEATLAEARSRYRSQARRLHPDVTGRTEDMVELNRDWEQVLEFFLS
jgi:hypothetical protein